MMDVYHSYNYGTAAWLLLQAAPLIFCPGVIIALLSPELREYTSLEEYFCRSLGLALLALAVLNLLLSGIIPVTSFSETADAKAPYAVPTVTVTFIYHTASAIYTYVRFTNEGQTSYVLGSIGSGSFAVMGLWCLMFANEVGHISRRTGADKRTSGFPLPNDEAEKKRKGKHL